jgi:hypothetical protein
MLVAGMAVAAVWPVSCANPGEELRQSLRAQSGIRAIDDEARDAAIHDAIAILDQKDPRGESTSMRWQAAHNLGTLGAFEGWDVLWSRAFSALSDRNAQVRRECVVALTRMPFESSKDPRRLELIDKLRRRAAFERSETFYSLLLERDATVRMALVEGLITLGRPVDVGNDALANTGKPGDRECANALTTLMHAFLSETSDRPDRFDVGTPTRYSPGLMETCIRGLAVITGTPDGTAAQARQGRSMTDYLAWWSEQISAMPDVDW